MAKNKKKKLKTYLIWWDDAENGTRLHGYSEAVSAEEAIEALAEAGLLYLTFGQIIKAEEVSEETLEFEVEATYTLVSEEED